MAFNGYKANVKPISQNSAQSIGNGFPVEGVRWPTGVLFKSPIYIRSRQESKGEQFPFFEECITKELALCLDLNNLFNFVFEILHGTKGNLSVNAQQLFDSMFDIIDRIAALVLDNHLHRLGGGDVKVDTWKPIKKFAIAQTPNGVEPIL